MSTVECPRRERRTGRQCQRGVDLTIVRVFVLGVVRGITGSAVIWSTIAYLGRPAGRLFAIHPSVVGDGMLPGVVPGLRHAGGL